MHLRNKYVLFVALAYLDISLYKKFKFGNFFVLEIVLQSMFDTWYFIIAPLNKVSVYGVECVIICLSYGGLYKIIRIYNSVRSIISKSRISAVFTFTRLLICRFKVYL